MDDDRLDELVHRADLDGLVRMVDDLCATRSWSTLLVLRDRAREAVATGRQLWPAATLAEFRLALLAPAADACRVLDEGSGRFTIGPLTEVVAQHHTWDELRAHLPDPTRAVYVAHERAIRGERVAEADVRELPPVLEVPVAIAPWEPGYPVAEYGDTTSRFPSPPAVTGLARVEPRPGAEVLDDPDVELATRQLVEPWTASSNGRAEVRCVEGDVLDALGAFGLRRARAVEIPASEALAWLAWAGASGGAQGRRRGAASGRFATWWLLGAIGDLHDEWPPHPDVVGRLLDGLRWWWWDADEPATGWRLQLVAHDPGEGVAWAINARDDR